MTSPDNKKYWYLRTIEKCCVCGAYTVYKERQYTERPVELDKRILCIHDMCATCKVGD